MCAGGNIDPQNPTHISAYLKRLSGWAERVTPLQHDQRLELPAGQNQYAIFARNGAEYFIIENRRKNGRDAALPAEGLAIWHVDEDGDNSNEQRTPARHYELSLEQADAQFRLESVRGHLGDANDLYGLAQTVFGDSTTPGSKWWDGTASDLEVFDISAPGDTVSFRTRLFAETGGQQSVTAESSPNLDIPDNDPGGAVDVLSVTEDGAIASAQVSVDITHSFRGDLQVTLQSPVGDQMVLHPRGQGGGADDLRAVFDESTHPDLARLHGQSTRGDWRLWVQDLAPADTGRLNRWSLKFSAAAAPIDRVILEESPGTHIPDNDPTGIERSLGTTAEGNVGEVELTVNITHTYIGDLRVALVSPSDTTILLHDRAGGPADDLEQTWTAATAADLANLSGEPIAGDWKLQVSDHAGRDVGKLNEWRLVIRR
jgi:subtilisin-like proprotein convertase family protein